jgi:hypothetical protein
MGLLRESALAMLVISYGICIYVGEVSWKSKLKVAFPDPNAYSVFMGNFSLATRSVTLIMMLLGSKIFQKFGFGEKVCLTSALASIVDWSHIAQTKKHNWEPRRHRSRYDESSDEVSFSNMSEGRDNGFSVT